MKLHGTKCAGNESKLAALLLDPEEASAEVRAHVEECESCTKELDELKSTMALLDTWESPEPSPFFLTRLEARIRQEREAEPAGWLTRKVAAMRAGLAIGSRVHVRPLAAMALTVLLLLGGGAYLDLTNWDQAAAPAKQTAVVHDLQTMENNAQLLDQLEALSSTSSETDNGN
jgi:cytochrome c-type biogenesis protein CcmH/NrfG